MSKGWDQKDISMGHLHGMGTQTPGPAPAPWDGAGYLLDLLGSL